MSVTPVRFGSRRLFRLLGRAVEVCKAEGLAGVRRRVWGRVRPRRKEFVIAVMRPVETVPRFPARKQVEVRRVTPDDRAIIQGLIGYDMWDWAHTPSDVIRRLTIDGNECFVALNNDVVYSSMWLSKDFYFEALQRYFRLGTQEIYVQQIFTPATLRGMGIIFQLFTEVYTYYHNQGVTCAVGLILPSNWNSLRVMERIGGRRAGRVGYVEFLGLRFNYLFTRMPVFENTTRFFFGRHRAD